MFIQNVVQSTCPHVRVSAMYKNTHLAFLSNSAVTFTLKYQLSVESTVDHIIKVKSLNAKAILTSGVGQPSQAQMLVRMLSFYQVPAF